VQAKYQAMKGVDGVRNPIDVIKKLLAIIDSARWFSIVVAVLVLTASVLLIANTIQVAAGQRRNETSIMRLVGASRWMTELPFMLETLVAVTFGGLISTIFVWVGKDYILGSVFKFPVEKGVIPNLDINDILVAGGSGLLVGLVLSGITAIVTLRFYVRL
jgi:cell division transport system permease protein